MAANADKGLEAEIRSLAIDYLEAVGGPKGFVGADIEAVEKALPTVMEGSEYLSQHYAAVCNAYGAQADVDSRMLVEATRMSMDSYFEHRSKKDTMIMETYAEGVTEVDIPQTVSEDMPENPWFFRNLHSNATTMNYWEITEWVDDNLEHLGERLSSSHDAQYGGGKLQDVSLASSNMLYLLPHMHEKMDDARVWQTIAYSSDGGLFEDAKRLGGLPDTVETVVDLRKDAISRLTSECYGKIREYSVGMPLDSADMGVVAYQFMKENIDSRAQEAFAKEMESWYDIDMAVGKKEYEARREAAMESVADFEERMREMDDYDEYLEAEKAEIESFDPNDDLPGEPYHLSHPELFYDEETLRTRHDNIDIPFAQRVADRMPESLREESEMPEEYRNQTGWETLHEIHRESMTGALLDDDFEAPF